MEFHHGNLSFSQDVVNYRHAAVFRAIREIVSFLMEDVGDYLRTGAPDVLAHTPIGSFYLI